MSRNTRIVETYLDGFRKNDHEQILSCLTDDIEWTVFGAFHLTGKQAYDDAIEGPGFVGPPQLEIVRMVEQDDVVMAELTGSVMRDTGEVMRMLRVLAGPGHASVASGRLPGAIGRG